MVTHGRAGIIKPNPKYALAASGQQLSLVPTSVCAAIKDPLWRDAMQLQDDAVQNNLTWTLIH